MVSICAFPQLDNSGFEKRVLDSPLPVLVQFIEQQCRECEMAQHLLAEVVGQSSGRMRCYCVHGPSSPVLTTRYRISQFPTILLFRNGQVSRRLVGHPLPGQLGTILRAEISPAAEVS